MAEILLGGRRMKRLLQLVLVTLIACLAPRLATAGCPSSSSQGCDMAMMPQASVTHATSCLTMTFEENECTCSTTLQIVNGCSEPLEAVGFAWCKYDDSADCATTIEPGATGYLFAPRPDAVALGQHTVTLQTMLGTTALPLTLTYEVVHLQRQGCSTTGGGTLAMLPVLLGLALRRRRARSHRA